MRINTNKHSLRPLKEICSDIALRFVELNLTQVEIQKNTGVNQSQISRIVNGDISRFSLNVKKLCEYANIDPFFYSNYDPSTDSAFMGVIESAVAGSPNRALAIAKVVKAVARALDVQI